LERLVQREKNLLIALIELMSFSERESSVPFGEEERNNKKVKSKGKGGQKSIP